ncbi:MAG: Cytochrome oxidase assembly [Pedosphaera sp.]|nr:Cytochrome oxidase assembly [Pedosphaera sp.]
MSRSVDNLWLHRFACLTALATLALIGLGGLVTSQGVGMSVPDWPTTYGYNMFLFPISQWVGGIFYEHTHRLVASGVGLLTTILALWLFGTKSRPLLRWGGVAFLLLGVVAGIWLPGDKHHTGATLVLVGAISLRASFFWPNCAPASQRLRWLGVLAFIAVALQGVLGGLRVVLFKDQIGIVHAALAQICLVILCALALFTSQWWRNLPDKFSPIIDRKGLRSLLLIGTLLIFAQLVLGATMRHQHAGLAIPDFPLAYHKLWPPMDAASVTAYNQNRMEVEAANPITAFQIGLQMVHRIMAVLILCAVTFCARTTRRQLGARHPLSRLSLAWLVLIMAQVVLGAFTIWSNKAADVATTHVVVGALSLVTGVILTITSFRVLMPVRSASLAATPSATSGLETRKPAASSAE